MLTRVPFFLPWIFPELTWRIKTSEKEIFLTFDDGPVYGPTEFVLDVLNECKIKATFFCIGDNVRKHPEVFRRILKEGHAVGNHTFNHMDGWGTPDTIYVHNTNYCDSYMKMTGKAELKNKTPEPGKPLFRPPYGRITPSQIKALKDYSIIMWDVLTRDYSHTLSGEKCLRRSIRATRPGSIVVFHDSLKAERNLHYVLPAYIHHFFNLGYSFKTLPL